MEKNNIKQIRNLYRNIFGQMKLIIVCFINNLFSCKIQNNIVFTGNNLFDFPGRQEKSKKLRED